MQSDRDMPPLMSESLIRLTHEWPLDAPLEGGRRLAS